MKKAVKLLISIAIPLLIGFFGSYFTAESVDSWYSTISKASFNPPGWVFGPAWTVLYIMIGLSFYFVWAVDFRKQKKTAITVYSCQLFFNFLWSFLFFGLKSPLLAFIDIILLWFFILANVFVFYHISKKAGLLLIPYLLWVSFAFMLNLAIVLLN